MSDKEGTGGGEKTHEPTQKRLDDARKKGDVAKSDEATGAAVYLGFAAGCLIVASGQRDGIGLDLAVFLDRADGLEGRVLGPGGLGLTARILGDWLAGFAPLFLLPPVFALAAVVAQRAFVVSGQKLKPQLSRISPLASLKQKFGPTGLMEFAKRVAKLIAVSAAMLLVARGQSDRILGSVTGAPGQQTALLFDLMMQLLAGIAAIACAIAVLDLAWVRFDHRRKLKMSLQELRDETKEAEGDPTFKGKRRQRAVEVATNRMLADVPRADVVIVNPTHVSVALRWTREAGTAPVCVAKGRDELALKIREVAAGAAVPLHRDPPTARALNDIVEVGQEIPPDHYRAVAAAIRFADALRARARERHGPPE